jgi:hypothetical protein
MFVDNIRTRCINTWRISDESYHLAILSSRIRTVSSAGKEDFEDVKTYVATVGWAWET